MTQQIDYSQILSGALSNDTMINQAYTAFHRFSFNNQMLAASQLAARGLPISPIASYSAWKEKGRQVNKGEKAIALFMPVTIKDKDTEDVKTIYILKNNWFSLNQTSGDDFAAEDISAQWNKAEAMKNLNITEEPFEHIDGNCMGYAYDRTIAINPLNQLKHKTRFHEIAHIVLGHTSDATLTDSATQTKNIIEVEAESVAFILTSIFKMRGKEESRGYIQSWLKTETIPSENAKRIFAAVDKILTAGK